MTSKLLFEQLHAEMADRPFLKANPVLVKARAGHMTKQEVTEAIRQYVRFPEEIVGMLKGAANHVPVDHSIHEELKRNCEQENGSATGGIPHVKILIHALKRDLGINAEHVIGSPSTERFISTILEGMNTSDTWFALGQAYALESSAVPELGIILGPTLNLYANLIGKPEPIKKVALTEKGTFPLPAIRNAEEALAMEMSAWFALHIVDFEVGHRDNLRACSAAVLTTDDSQALFAEGYRHVLDAMDAWWSGLAKGE